MEPFDTIIFLQ